MVDSNFDEEILYLRKRARRRLVGAIALVFFALLVLWTSLDNRPLERPVLDRSIEIISSDFVSPDEPAEVLESTRVHRRPPATQIIIAPTIPIELQGAGKVSVSKSGAASVPAGHGANTERGEQRSPEDIRVERNHAVQTLKSDKSIPASTTPKREKLNLSEKSRVVPELGTIASYVEPQFAAGASPTDDRNLILRGKLTYQKRGIPASPQLIASRPLSRRSEGLRRILEGLDDSDTADPLTGKSSASYFVQVAALLDPIKAQQLVAQLRSLGLPVSSNRIKTARKELIRVRIGPTGDEAKVREWLKKVKMMGIASVQVVSQ